MTFILRYTYERLLKAKGKRKPDWIDFKVRAEESKRAYAIAAQNEGRFSFAFRQAMRDVLPERAPVGFGQAVKEGNIDAAMRALPLIEQGNEAEERLKNLLSNAYMDVLRRSGKLAMDELNDQFGVNFGFTTSDGSSAEVLKANIEDIVSTEAELAAQRWLTPIVPINPHAKKWVMEHVMEFVEQGITPQQFQTVSTLLKDGFSRGLRPEKLYKEIRANIGLHDKWANAVIKRRQLLEAQGMPQSQVEKLTNLYSEQLIKRRAENIARTETIKAQAEGRRQAWSLVEESGNMPEVEREWVSAPGSDNPDRPCEICLDLDGKTAPITGHYESIDGPIQSPPSHPGCRCTETLKRVKK